MMERYNSNPTERFMVFNDTDEIFASPKQMSLKEARKFVADFHKRYRMQGYYLTSDGIRINPMDVSLSIVTV